MADTNHNDDFNNDQSDENINGNNVNSDINADIDCDKTDKADEDTDALGKFRIPSKKTLFFSSIILLVISVITSGLSAALSASVIAKLFLLIVATVAASSAMCLKKTPLMAISAPLAYVLALVLTRNPVAALSAIIFFPAALVCTNSISKAKPRVSAICRISAVLVISEIIIFVISFIATYGSISFELLKEWFGGYFNSMTQAFVDAFGANEELAQLFEDEQIRSAITLVFLVSPGAIISAYNIVAFLIQKFTLVVLKLHYNDKLLFEDAETFKMSKPSAIIYIVCYILSIVFAGGDGISALSAVCANLIIILMPGLFFLGIKTFFGRTRKRLSPKSSLLVFGTVFLLVLFPALILAVASIYGVWVALSSKYAD